MLLKHLKIRERFKIVFFGLILTLCSLVSKPAFTNEGCDKLWKTTNLLLFKSINKQEIVPEPTADSMIKDGLCIKADLSLEVTPFDIIKSSTGNLYVDIKKLKGKAIEHMFFLQYPYKISFSGAPSPVDAEDLGFKGECMLPFHVTLEPARLVSVGLEFDDKEPDKEPRVFEGMEFWGIKGVKPVASDSRCSNITQISPPKPSNFMFTPNDGDLEIRYAKNLIFTIPSVCLDENGGCLVDGKLDLQEEKFKPQVIKERTNRVNHMAKQKLKQDKELLRGAKLIVSNLSLERNQ